MAHSVSYTVYYEDTDSLGVVYYANYFKFFERGRTELIGARGANVAQWNADGIAVVVHKAGATFRKPARLGDRVDVVSTFAVDSPFRGRFTQRIERAGELLVDGVIDVVCLDAAGQLIELPQALRALAD